MSTYKLYKHNGKGWILVGTFDRVEYAKFMASMTPGRYRIVRVAKQK